MNLNLLRRFSHPVRSALNPERRREADVSRKTQGGLMRIMVIAMGLCGMFACGGGGSGAEDGALPAADLGSTGSDAGTPRRVLFIGNSYTYVNDLPRTVEALGAATPGAAVTAEMIAEGGASLLSHWNKPGTRAAHGRRLRPGGDAGAEPRAGARARGV